MMTEYTNKPYVYRITHKVTKEFYIGYREKNEVQSHLDLGVAYATSSEVIKDMGFNNFNIVILCECYHEDRKIAGDNAYDIENEMIAEEFDDPLCLNGHYHKFNGDNRFKAKFGRVVSEDTRVKMSESQKGKKHTEEARANMTKAQMGRKHTKETKELIGKANKGKIASEETKQKLSNRVFSEEHKLKLRKPKSDIARENMSKGQKKKAPMSEETRNKHRGKTASIETRAKMSGTVACFNLLTKEVAKIDKKTFDEFNGIIYVGVNSKIYREYKQSL